MLASRQQNPSSKASPRDKLLRSATASQPLHSFEAFLDGLAVTFVFRTVALLFNVRLPWIIVLPLAIRFGIGSIGLALVS